jgi:2-dehydropantoate 2-reductase
MRMAVVGAGSLGIVVGGLLARAGRDVELVAPRRESADLLNREGAVLTGGIEAVIPVRAVTPDQMRGPYDFALMLTKLDALPGALAELAPHLRPQSLVCALENGMPEDMAARAVGRERTCGGVVLIGAARKAPNASHITSSQATLDTAFAIGELDGAATPRIAALRDVLADVGGCRVAPDLLDLRWAKLLMNAAPGAMNAMLGCTNRQALADDRSLALMVRAADETIRVAHAAGHRLALLQGNDMEALIIPEGGRPEDRFELCREYFMPWGDTRSSMQQDLAAGRRTEVRHLNGYVAARGRELGVATPVNDLIQRLVMEAEARGRAPEYPASLERALAELAAG